MWLLENGWSLEGLVSGLEGTDMLRACPVSQNVAKGSRRVGGSGGRRPRLLLQRVCNTSGPYHWLCFQAYLRSSCWLGMHIGQENCGEKASSRLAEVTGHGVRRDRGDRVASLVRNMDTSFSWPQCQGRPPWPDPGLLHALFQLSLKSASPWESPTPPSDIWSVLRPPPIPRWCWVPQAWL